MQELINQETISALSKSKKISYTVTLLTYLIGEDKNQIIEYIQNREYHKTNK